MAQSQSDLFDVRLRCLLEDADYNTLPNWTKLIAESLNNGVPSDHIREALLQTEKNGLVSSEIALGSRSFLEKVLGRKMLVRGLAALVAGIVGGIVWVSNNFYRGAGFFGIQTFLVGLFGFGLVFTVIGAFKWRTGSAIR